MEPIVVTGRRGVTIGLLLLLGAAVTGFAYVALRFWTERGGALPPASWGAFIVLLFMAVGVFFAGLPVRRFLRGTAKKPLNPMRAMRTVVLAQASALTGALVTGWYVAQILILLPDLDISSRRSLAWRLGALAVGGILMAVAGLVVQAMCRVGGNGDHDSETRSGSRPERRTGSRGGKGRDGGEDADRSPEHR
jgi:hypothetical protein